MNKQLLLIVVLCALAAQANAATKPTPVKAVYFDVEAGCTAMKNAVADGFNVLILAFYTRHGTSVAQSSALHSFIDSAGHATCINQLHSLGAIVMFSVGGAADNPYPNSAIANDGLSFGEEVGNFALANGFDGVDFDLENLNDGLAYKKNGLSSSYMLNWMAQLGQGVKTVSSSLLVSHAPQGPYFGPDGGSYAYPGPQGGYTEVYALGGQYIDWFNVQYYNQGSGCYTTYNGLFIHSADDCNGNNPGQSVGEIHSYGIPLNKIVVGKENEADAGSSPISDYVPASELNTFFTQAWHDLGWAGGIMTWEYHTNSIVQHFCPTIFAGINYNTCTASNCASCVSGSSTTCATCNSGYYVSGGTCHACTATCASGTYKSASCTATANTVCSTCSTCASGQYQKTACSSTANTVCATCSTCPAGQQVSTPCGGSQNTICSAIPSSTGGSVGASTGSSGPLLPKPSPIKSIYIDNSGSTYGWTGANPCAAVKGAVADGFNVIIWAFYVRTNGGTPVATSGLNSFEETSHWSANAGTMAQCLAAAHNAGALVMLSVGGGDAAPYPTSAITGDGLTLGKEAAQYAIAHGFDGVDFAFSSIANGFTYGSLTAAYLTQWMADCATGVKQTSSALYVSFAEVAPYFGAVNAATATNPLAGTSGGISQVYALGGAHIDWITVLYYNHGAGCYTSLNGIFFHSASDCNGAEPGQSVSEIATYGIPLNKIVVGKYLESDASSGYVSAVNLNPMFQAAWTSLGWKGGINLWEYDASTITQGFLGSVFAGINYNIVPRASTIKSIYIDNSGSTYGWTGANPCAAVKGAVADGFNVIIWAFYVRTNGGTPVATSGLNSFEETSHWSANAGTMAQCLAAAHNAGALVMLSVGGGDAAPYPTSAITGDGLTLGKEAAQYAIAHGFDGVDFAFSSIANGFTYGSLTAAYLTQWMADCATGVKQTSTSLYVSFAEVAPYFGKPNAATATNPLAGTSGGISQVYALGGAHIDWITVLYYNHGKGCYTSYKGIFVQSSADCSGAEPGQSVSEIASYGIPLNKIVVGKYLENDASSAYVSAADLAPMFSQAWTSLGWHGGINLWEYDATTITRGFLGTVFAGINYNAPAAAEESTPPSPNPPATTSHKSIQWKIYGPVIAGGVVFLAAVIVAVVICRRRRAQSNAATTKASAHMSADFSPASPTATSTTQSQSQPEAQADEGQATVAIEMSETQTAADHV